MLKNFLSFFLLLFLFNCASPSAFLGPVMTGAKSGSIYQASLSYSSGQIINLLNDSNEEKKMIDKEVNILENLNRKSQPAVLVAILTSSVEISEIEETEPLP